MTFKVGGFVELIGAEWGAGTSPERGTVHRIISVESDGSAKITGGWLVDNNPLGIWGGKPVNSQEETRESINNFSTDVNDVLTEVGRLLISKNDAYGNSALDPVRIFSQADPVEGISQRIDDKLSRIARGSEVGEDTVLDLIGYLVLYRLARKNG